MDVIKTRYRFCYKVIRNVYPGEALLTLPNYGGEHFDSDAAIERYVLFTSYCALFK